jgi:hypothetical protein
MGKRKGMATIQLEDLRNLDHAIFGQVIIARQSSSEIKEASMFIEKPAPKNRVLEKAKSDNTMELQRRTVYRRVGSLTSEIPQYENRITNDFKYKNGIELKDGQKIKNISVRNWHSAELPTMVEQRKMSSDYLNKKPNLPTVPPFADEHNNFHSSLSRFSSLGEPASTEERPSCNRRLSSSSRKSLSFYGSSSLSRESSIEEEKEVDNGSSTSENCTKLRIASGTNTRRRVSQLVDELLLDIYGKWYCNGLGLSFNRHRHSANSSAYESDYCSTSDASAALKSQVHHPINGMNDSLQQSRLKYRSEYIKCIDQFNFQTVLSSGKYRGVAR